MTTVATIKAKDVHEAARLTHNRIVQQRLDLMNERVLHWQAWCNRFPWKLFPHRTENDYRIDTRRMPSIKIFPDQFARCRVILALCEGALERDDKNATVEIDNDDMAQIEWGWFKIMHNRKSEPYTGAEKDQYVKLVKGEWPKPDIVFTKSLIAGGDVLSGKALLREDKPLLTDELEAKSPSKSLAPPPADEA